MKRATGHETEIRHLRAWNKRGVQTRRPLAEFI